MPFEKVALFPGSCLIKSKTSFLKIVSKEKVSFPKFSSIFLQLSSSSKFIFPVDSRRFKPLVKFVKHSLKVLENFLLQLRQQMITDYNIICVKRNAFASAKSIKAKHPENLFFGHLNVNSICNKFVSIQELIQRTFDLFLISETKIDDLFPNAQCLENASQIIWKISNQNHISWITNTKSCH